MRIVCFEALFSSNSSPKRQGRQPASGLPPGRERHPVLLHRDLPQLLELLAQKHGGTRSGRDGRQRRVRIPAFAPNSRNLWHYSTKHFFKYGPFPASFKISFIFLVHWYNYDWFTIFNQDRKQERRIEVSLILWSMTSLIEIAQRPARIE